MTLDERTLRAAGLPASLISLLVNITKAAERATAAANSAAVASNLEPQISAAVQALEKMEVVPGLATQIDALSGRLTQVEATRPVVSLELEDNRLILVMADGLRIDGPVLPVGASEPIIILTGGSLTVTGEDLVIAAPTATIQNGGYYTPGEIIVSLSLTRGGLDVTADVQEGRLPNAPAGEYIATWTATDGVLPPAIKTASRTVIAGSVPNAFATNQWSVSRGNNAGEIIVNVATLPANNGNSITLIEYLADTEWMALEGAGVGSRTIMMPEVGAYYEISLRAWNAAGPSAPSAAKGATSGGQATAAPAVTSPPTISGNTTVGSILGGTVGSATGIPAPTASTTWLRNSTILDGQTGDTLDTSGFAVGDVILRRTTWANNINGQVQSATATSDPWTLTEQPAITATPPTLTQGQLATIPFNTNPDTVTVTQGQTVLPAARVGTTNDYTFTPVTTEPVSIAATKAGWTAYSAIGLAVQAPVAELFAATNPSVFGFRKLSSTTSTFALSAPAQYAGTGSVSTAKAINGPEAYIEPSVVTVSGNAIAIGETLRFRKGAFLSGYQGKPAFTWEWWADDTKLSNTGDTLAIAAGHAGKLISVQWRAADVNGPTYGTAFANGIVPNGSASIVSNFAAADGTTIADYSGTPDAGRTFNKFGSASVLGVITSGYLHGGDTNGTGFVATSDNVSSGNYRVTAVMHSVIGSPSGGTTDRGVYPAVGIKAGNTGFLFRNDLSGQGLRVVKYAAGTQSVKVGGVPAIVGKDTEYTFVFEVTGTSCKVFINGAVVPGLAFTDPDLAGGVGGYHHLRGGFDYNKLNSLTVEAI